MSQFNAFNVSKASNYAKRLQTMFKTDAQKRDDVNNQGLTGQRFFAKDIKDGKGAYGAFQMGAMSTTPPCARAGASGGSSLVCP